MRYLDILEARVNKKIEKATRAGTNYLTGNRRDDQTPETLKGRFIKAGEDLTAGQRRAMHKEALALKARLKKGKKKEATNEARKPSTKNILDRREKARKYRAAMLARIKAGLDTEPAEQTGRIPGPKPGEKPKKKKLKAEAYIQLGDVLAEAISSAVLKTKATRDRRRTRRAAVTKGRKDQVKKSTKKNDVENLRKANRSLDRANSDLRNIKYREDEVKETEG